MRRLVAWLRNKGGETAVAVDESSFEDDVVRLEATDTLDLHAFHPRDAKSVVVEFLNEAVSAGHLQVRIIHGKGIGVQRRTVRALLDADPRVLSYSDAPDASGWGATVARLRRQPHASVVEAERESDPENR